VPLCVEVAATLRGIVASGRAAGPSATGQGGGDMGGGRDMTSIAGLRAGWFADPAGRFRFRYWDGDAWTDQVLDGTSREEATDVLEPALATLPPRPALPTLPGARRR